MRNIKIRPRLLIGFMVIVLLVVITGGYGIFAITTTSNDTQLLNVRATSAILSGNLATNINFQRALGRDSALAAPSVWNVPSIFEDNVRQLAEADDEFNATVTKLEKLLVAEESKEILSAIVFDYREFYAGCENLISVLRSSSSTPEEVVAALDASTIPYNSAVSSIKELSDFLDRITDDQAIAAASHAKFTTNIMIGGVIIAMAIAIILSLYISRIISAPINIMSDLLTQAGKTGNLMFTDSELERARKEMIFRDEVSQSVAAFVTLIENLIYCCTTLETVANGDLAVNVNLISDTDTIGLSLQKMIENLNSMFGEIDASSRQVSIGSRQVADGAQSLAQGATEQASAIEELSSSISEITEQTKKNADLSNESADLIAIIRMNAEKGSVQMDQMMQAVKEINEASNQISKVIKVIDDIAFQTNILALNAAVEAARAGQHGKGFAVVAEEVRNLAAKSAEAAKDTGGLIENSIAKANLGMNIATETSVSLKEIVDGINQGAEIMIQIARASDEQAGAIEQINIAIDQVEQVVQQNSATAEESAAASEEMNAQSSMLEQLVSHFKLKDTDYSSLSSASSNHYKEEYVMPKAPTFVLVDNQSDKFEKY